MSEHRQSDKIECFLIGLVDIAFLVEHYNSGIDGIDNLFVVFLPLLGILSGLKQNLSDAVEGVVDQDVVGRKIFGGIFESIIGIVDGIEHKSYFLHIAAIELIETVEYINPQ